jgi:hypothetical protein
MFGFDPIINNLVDVRFFIMIIIPRCVAVEKRGIFATVFYVVIWFTIINGMKNIIGNFIIILSGFYRIRYIR